MRHPNAVHQIKARPQYEIMAYAAEARSKALGRIPVVVGIENVDLARSFSRIWLVDPSGRDYADHKWHTAQFRSTNIRQKDYWHTLLSGTVNGFGIQ